jgi:hypothetical protein
MRSASARVCVPVSPFCWPARPGPSCSGVSSWVVWPLRYSWLLVLSVVGSGALSCSGDTVFGAQPVHDPSTIYWALTFNQHAVTMALTAPYDTVTLVATPRTPAGAPLTGLGAVTYTTLSGDSSVMVSPTGLVTARAVTNQTQVIATLTAQTYTLADTVDIQVTATLPASPVATFSVQPPPGIRAQGFYSGNGNRQNYYSIHVTALDAAGDTVCNQNGCTFQVYYTSSNPELVNIIDRQFGGETVNDTGHVTLTATALVYGKGMADSVHYIGNWDDREEVYSTTLSGVFKGIPIYKSYPQTGIAGTIRLCVGGILSFAGDSIADEIIFDTPSVVAAGVDSLYLPDFGFGWGPNGSGNIPRVGGPLTQSDSVLLNQCIAGGACKPYFDAVRPVRSFPTPGTVRFYSGLYPSDTMTVIVQDVQ